MTSPATLTLGVITPHAAPGPEVEWPAMTSHHVDVRVARVPAPGRTVDEPGPPPEGPAALRARATPAALRAALADRVLADVGAIGYASTTTGYVIGPQAERVLLDLVAQSCGVPVVGAAAAATAALRAIDTERVALLHPPWFDHDTQDLGAAYFRREGFDVVASTSIDLDITPQHPDVDRVAAWIPRHVPDTAQAVVIGGNGFRTACIIHRLELQLSRPVVTANQVLLRQLLPLALAVCDAGPMHLRCAVAGDEAVDVDSDFADSLDVDGHDEVRARRECSGKGQ